MYDPKELKRHYDRLAHGKAKVAAIRQAIEEADANNDRPYQFFFRLELCQESEFYGDSLDLLVVFPELLSLADRYPDTPATEHQLAFTNAVDHVLWDYKWLLSTCKHYYQIPMDDCMKFFEDFKQRSLAYGYSLRSYYYYQYDFYQHIDREKAKEAFYAFEQMPRDGNSDCRACERNTAIEFYLEQGDLRRAAELSGDIENRRLRCGDFYRAWLEMKGNYLSHYMDAGNLEEALRHCELLERTPREESDDQRWDDLICCYAHSDLGRALRLYKEHWKELQENRKPTSIFWIGLHLGHFFQKLSEDGEKPTVKLSLDPSFPLYRESGEYDISSLSEYYWQRARDMAEKLDARNGVDYYQDVLKKGINL